MLPLINANAIFNKVLSRAIVAPPATHNITSRVCIMSVKGSHQDERSLSRAGLAVQIRQSRHISQPARQLYKASHRNTPWL